jgi:tetratricopeptide (TPR) repeat protein
MQIFFRLTATALLLLLAPPDLAARSISVSEQKVLYAAQQAEEAGNPERASNILKDHIRRRRVPGSELYLALGNILQSSGKPHNAEAVFRQGLKIHPDASSLLVNLAIICADAHRFTEAGSLFARAAAVTHNHDLTYQAAAAYFQTGAMPRALSLLRTLTEQAEHPRNEWLQLLIHVCMERKDFDLARHTLHRFLERSPSKKAYWKLLSRIHLEQNRYCKAASALEIALALPGAEYREWRELGNVYFRMDAPLEAAACYEKGLGKNPKARWLDLLASCYERAGRPKQACDALDRAIAIAPTRDRFLQKARIRYTAGDYARCQADAESCVQRFGEDGEAQYLAGVCAVERGTWEEAAESFKAAMKNERFRESAGGYLQILKEWRESEFDAEE